jgi:hypothetical protein
MGLVRMARGKENSYAFIRLGNRNPQPEKGALPSAAFHFHHAPVEQGYVADNGKAHAGISQVFGKKIFEPGKVLFREALVKAHFHPMGNDLFLRKIVLWLLFLRQKVENHMLTFIFYFSSPLSSCAQ